jgi:hypothetical protein
VLVAGESTTLLSTENDVSFGMECILPPQCVYLEIGSVYSKKAYSGELKKHMYLSKENHAC